MICKRYCSRSHEQSLSSQKCTRGLQPLRTAAAPKVRYGKVTRPGKALSGATAALGFYISHFAKNQAGEHEKRAVSRNDNKGRITEAIHAPGRA
jgi:hypothetical protein